MIVMNRRARYRQDVAPSLPLKLTQRGIIVIGILLFVVGGVLSATFTVARNSALAAVAGAGISQTGIPAESNPNGTEPPSENAAASSSSIAEPATSRNQSEKPMDAEGTFDVTNIPTSDDPLLVLVRKDVPLKPKEFKPKNLVSLAPGKTLVKEAADHFSKLLTDAATAGHSLRIESGYRSYTAQANLFNRYSQKYGEAYAEKISARPGTSEHQTGLAADIGLSNGECSLHRCFGDTAAGKWVAAHAADYGFIIRYPSEHVDVTGYNYEPWHLRYIGVGQAKAFVESGKGTLEEFLAAQ